MRQTYPFTAIVGQERMKRALILNAINPQIGGVLIRGERGTAKSTAARALAALLPPLDVVQGCRFNCDPNRPDLFCDECRERLERQGTLPTSNAADPLCGPAGQRHRRPCGGHAGHRKGHPEAANATLNPASWPLPIAACSTSTKSTCSTTTSSTCCSTAPPWASTWSSAKASASSTLRALCWSAP